MIAISPYGVVNNVDYVLIVISRYFLIFEDFLRHMITSATFMKIDRKYTKRKLGIPNTYYFYLARK